METLPTIKLNTASSSATNKRPIARRYKGRNADSQGTIWFVIVSLFGIASVGGYAFYELGKTPAKKQGLKSVKSTADASFGLKARQKASSKKSPSQKTGTKNTSPSVVARSKASKATPPAQTPVAAKSITEQQFHSVPQGTQRFVVEDAFGSPLEATHDFEEVERFGSNGETFGSEFVNTFVLFYGVSDRPGHIALFMFQGQGTNPPLVDKEIRGQ